MTEPTPTAVRLDLARNLLEIDWADGLRSRYDGAYLRFVCPCAGCRGHGPGQVPPPAWEQVKDVRLRHVEAVGAYALRFDFSDGHVTGIYTWEALHHASPANHPTLDDVGRPRQA